MGVRHWTVDIRLWTMDFGLSSIVYGLLCLLSFVYGLRSNFNLIYDSNPFLLSDSQIALFLEGKDMGFKTYDDLVAKMRFEGMHFLRGESRLRLSFASNLFFQNPSKSYAEFGLQYKRFFGRIDRYGEMEYSFLPNYLIRPLKKEGRFFNLSYSSHSWEGRFKLKTVQFLLGFSLLNYPMDYDFYDSKIYSLGISNEIKFRERNKKLILGLKGNLLSARGDLPDISYQGMEVRLGYKTTRFRLNLVGERRNFMTKIDKRHKGRRDLIGEVLSTFSFPLAKKISLFCAYEFKIRETTAEIIEESEVRDYKRHRIGIGVRYE